jgi:hypothetical protein
MQKIRSAISGEEQAARLGKRVLVEDVARSLGMSKRTLARKLADEKFRGALGKPNAGIRGDPPDALQASLPHHLQADAALVALTGRAVIRRDRGHRQGAPGQHFR